MSETEKRLAEVVEALKAKNLLGGGQKPTLLEATKVPVRSPATLLKLERQRHILEINQFKDGAIFFSIRTSDPQHATYIGTLVRPHVETWEILVDRNLPHYCSAELYELWNKMPPRKRVDSVTFTAKNGLLALARLAEAFAALPASGT